MTDEKKNWRKAFEMVGPDTLRLKLATSNVTLATEYIRCAEKWILEKEAEKAAVESKGFHKILGWTIAGTLAAIIAAVAAIISAWPVVH